MVQQDAVSRMKNRGYTYHDQIGRQDAGVTVLEYYLRRYGHSTRVEWSSHFAAGRIMRNGRISESDETLSAGDRLEYHRPPWEEPDVPTEIPLLAEGDGWMVFSKPSGLPVLPGGGFLEHTMLHMLRARYRQCAAALSPVHRLGRGTSGAILFSCRADAAAALAAAMREERISKTYLALVRGIPAQYRFTVTVPIGRVPHPLLGTVWAASEKGKQSESRCRVLRRDPVRGVALLEVDIPTGRPHQIRIHCAAAGYPLTGDPLYGPGGTPLTPSTAPFSATTNTESVTSSTTEARAAFGERAAVPGDCGYFLHSWKLRFSDPVSGRLRCVAAPPPPDLDPNR